MVPIPAVAVIYSLKALLKWKGGAGEQTGNLSPSAGGLIPGGVTVLNNTRGVAAQTGWGASCSRDNSRWCSVKKTVFVYTRSPSFCLYQGVSIHTSGLAVASASMAGTVPSSGCGGVYAAGVWSEMAGGSPAGRPLQYPMP